MKKIVIAPYFQPTRLLRQRSFAVPIALLSCLAFAPTAFLPVTVRAGAARLVTEDDLRRTEQRLNERLERVFALIQLENAPKLNPTEVDNLNGDATKAGGRLKAITDKSRGQAEEVLRKFREAAEQFRTVTRETAREKVEKITADTQEQAERLRAQVAETSSKYYAEADKFRDSLKFEADKFAALVNGNASVASDVTKAVINLGSILAPNPSAKDLVAAANALTRDGCWTSAMLAAFPNEVLPAQLQAKAAEDFIKLAKEKKLLDDGAAEALTFATSCITLAMQTGNPYVIAAAIILSILAMIFGGHGNGGGGEGKGKGSTEGDNAAGPGLGGNPPVTNEPTPGQSPAPEPGGTEAKTKVKLPGGDVSVDGTWPKLTFKKNGTIVLRVDLSKVEGGEATANGLWTDDSLPYDMKPTLEEVNYVLMYSQKVLDVSGAIKTKRWRIAEGQSMDSEGYHSVTAKKLN